MKKIIVLCLALTVLALTGCKTSEANYRAAYEKAKDKGRSDAVDPEVYEKIDREESPATLTFDGVSFTGRTMYLTPAKEIDPEAGKIDRFSVCTARFRQTFNAKSMARRLRENGFDGAFVARDRDGAYYVVAATTASATDAAEILERVKGAQIGAVEPFPYIVARP